jgi:hypothetical protein
VEAPGGAGGEFGFGVVLQTVGGANVVRVLGGVVRVGVEADAGGFCFESGWLNGGEPRKTPNFTKRGRVEPLMDSDEH